MFSEMLAIKQFREQQAELAFFRQRERRASALKNREDAAASLARYSAWARDRETALYTDLCEKVVRIREIDSVLQTVASLRQGEEQHQTSLQQANEALQAETTQLSLCREAHAQAERICHKFLELAQAHQEDEARMEMGREDLELEEVASVVWERAERGQEALI